MNSQYAITLRHISEDGLPTEQDAKDFHVAFLFDGCIVSGWCLKGCDNKDDGFVGDYTDGDWESDSDVGRNGVFSGITHYVLMPRELMYVIYKHGKYPEMNKQLANLINKQN